MIPANDYGIARPFDAQRSGSVLGGDSEAPTRVCTHRISPRSPRMHVRLCTRSAVRDVRAWIDVSSPSSGRFPQVNVGCILPVRGRTKVRIKHLLRCGLGCVAAVAPKRTHATRAFCDRDLKKRFLAAPNTCTLTSWSESRVLSTVLYRWPYVRKSKEY